MKIVEQVALQTRAWEARERADRQLAQVAEVAEAERLAFEPSPPEEVPMAWDPETYCDDN